MPEAPHWPTVCEDLLETAKGMRVNARKGLLHEHGDLAAAAAFMALQGLAKALARGIEAADAMAADAPAPETQKARRPG